MGNKILMVLEHPFPADIRVEKEAKALIAAGFSLTLVCPQRENQAMEDSFLGIRILRFVSLKNKWLGRALQLVNIVLQWYPQWERAILQAIDQARPDILHVHDLMLGQATINAARKRNLPVVLDFHENYPSGYQQWNRFRKGLAKAFFSLFGSYRRWLNIEGICCRRATHIITVVEEMKTCLMQRHGLPADKITVVTNTEEKAFAQGTLDPDIVKKYQGIFALMYIGGVSPHRGLDTVIKALPTLVKVIPNVRLVIIGRGDVNLIAYLKTLSRELKVEALVEWISWQPFEKIFSYMAAGKIGLVPHSSNDHTENTIPHKLFQYMMVRLPVMVSDCSPLKKVVDQTQAGIVFKADDPLDFAEQLRRNSSAASLSKMGENGYQATVLGELNWENTALRLVELYSNLLKSH